MSGVLGARVARFSRLANISAETAKRFFLGEKCSETTLVKIEQAKAINPELFESIVSALGQ